MPQELVDKSWSSLNFRDINEHYDQIKLGLSPNNPIDAHKQIIQSNAIIRDKRKTVKKNKKGKNQILDFKSFDEDFKSEANSAISQLNSQQRGTVYTDVNHEEQKV